VREVLDHVDDDERSMHDGRVNGSFERV